MTNNHMKAQQLIDWIHGARTFGEKNGLRNMQRMLALLGNPQNRFRSIHVAGTNGKGSVCAFLERALRENGCRTGLFTSPFLVQYQERIRLDGQPVGDDLFVRLGQKVYDAAQQLTQEGIRPTSFELGAALAFLVFADQGVDIAIIEVGLGGRLDPTNVIEPIACVIANIGLDHTQILGSTLTEIAREKAGIIKDHVPLALYPAQQDVFQLMRQTCAERGAPLLYAADYEVQILHVDAQGAQFEAEVPGHGQMTVCIRMAGRHQVRNAQLSLMALTMLENAGFSLDWRKLLVGIELAEWPGRLQWIDDGMLLDGAHNEQGVHALVDYIGEFLPSRRIVMLTAMMKDKRPETCARLLSGIADEVITTQLDLPNAFPAEQLAQLYQNQGKTTHSEPDISAALQLAQNRMQDSPDSMILVCGSLYLVGAVQAMLMG